MSEDKCGVEKRPNEDDRTGDRTEKPASVSITAGPYPW